MKKILTAAALTLALAAGGTTTATALHKDVNLIVDGQPVRGGAFAVTVADVLTANGITLKAGDAVTPALGATVEDGQQVAVTYAKPISLTINGKTTELVTKARTLAEVPQVAELPDLSQAWTSVALDAPLPRTGIDIAVSTPKAIQLKVAGKTKVVTTTANTVADLLAENQLTPDSDDIVSPAPATVLTVDAKVRWDQVETTTKTVTEAVAAPVIKKKNTTLWAGESKTLVKGKAGKATRTYKITIINGKVDSKVIVTELVLVKPKTATVEVGTKTSPNGVGINLARAAMWDRIARCESGGNWQINTGNGYYGGLQFSAASWRAMGGRDFAALPHQASRAQQITVANRYYAISGLGPWGCAHAA
ncbi:MAG: transglycosylase family protein [Propionicimonas sp.]